MYLNVVVNSAARVVDMGNERGDSITSPSPCVTSMCFLSLGFRVISILNSSN